MKFKIKNCSECAFWNSPERFRPKEFCLDHEDRENQPLAIIKEIKEVKKRRRGKRTFLWTSTLALLIFAIYFFTRLFSEMKKSGIIFYSISLTLSTVSSLIVIYEIIGNEKETKQELKQLQKKKSEWIIDYDK